MPLNIPDNLPAIEVLKKENIFVMQEKFARHQDIRPLQIAILNLMPLKIETEIHILRQLSNTPLQVEITLLRTRDHVSTHTPKEHLEAFYKTFDYIRNRKMDGLVITGAPVEKLEFEDVDYWNEMKEIMNWAKDNVTSTLHICWAAQAGLYHHYNVKKHIVDKKIFGVFRHTVNNPHVPLMRGFDDEFFAPHSRYTTVLREDILAIPQLDLLSESADAGVYIVADIKGKNIFVTGHSEYDPMTLKKEYIRDINKGLPIHIPVNYFLNDDPSKPPVIRWKSHANLLYSNWLNYYVYQVTSMDYFK